MEDFQTLLNSLSEIMKFTKYSLISNFVRTIYFLAFNLVNGKIKQKVIKALVRLYFHKHCIPYLCFLMAVQDQFIHRSLFL